MGGCGEKERGQGVQDYMRPARAQFIDGIFGVFRSRSHSGRTRETYVDETGQDDSRCSTRGSGELSNTSVTMLRSARNRWQGPRAAR